MVEKTWRHVKIGFLFLVVIIVTGTIGYDFLVEDWSTLDAFYMTIITITTTGFREIHPLSTPGKIFTSFLIITGVGAIA
ncbi:MAG: ion channel, partial [Calditrichia bacterium]